MHPKKEADYIVIHAAFRFCAILARLVRSVFTVSENILHGFVDRLVLKTIRNSFTYTFPWKIIHYCSLISEKSHAVHASRPFLCTLCI